MNPIERLTEKLIHGDSKKAVLVHSRPNRYYLTSFPSSDGVLLVTAEKAYYLLDFRYAEAGAENAQKKILPAALQIAGHQPELFLPG